MELERNKNNCGLMILHCPNVIMAFEHQGFVEVIVRKNGVLESRERENKTTVD